MLLFCRVSTGTRIEAGRVTSKSPLIKGGCEKIEPANLPWPLSPLGRGKGNTKPNSLAPIGGEGGQSPGDGAIGGHSEFFHSFKGGQRSRSEREGVVSPQPVASPGQPPRPAASPFVKGKSFCLEAALRPLVTLTHPFPGRSQFASLSTRCDIFLIPERRSVNILWQKEKLGRSSTGRIFRRYWLSFA